MSLAPLPHQVDPFKWAERGMRLDLEAPLKDFSRLLDAVYSADGAVRVKGEFVPDARGHAVLDLSLESSVMMPCQRCLEPMAVEIQAQTRFHVLRDEAHAESLGEEEDYVVADEEGFLDLRDLVEDELLLSLPLVPRHESCEPPVHDVDEAANDDAAPERENPFKVLESLKQRRDE